MKERRKHKRYKINQGAFATIPSLFIIGQIINISKGGLAFNCKSSGKHNYNVAEMDIFTDNTDFYLSEVPFRTVSDIEIDSQGPFSALKMRKLGGQFMAMTQNKISLLEEFIQKYTINETE